MEACETHQRLNSELPFGPLDNIKEGLIVPVEKQLGNLAEIAETLVTLMNQDEESADCHIE